MKTRSPKSKKILEKKRLSAIQKQEGQRVEKLGFFHGFGQTLAMMTFFSLKQNRPGKCVL